MIIKETENGIHILINLTGDENEDEEYEDYDDYEDEYYDEDEYDDEMDYETKNQLLKDIFTEHLSLLFTALEEAGLDSDNVSGTFKYEDDTYGVDVEW